MRRGRIELPIPSLLETRITQQFDLVFDAQSPALPRAFHTSEHALPVLIS
jgi:hypothetical protein